MAKAKAAGREARSAAAVKAWFVGRYGTAGGCVKAAEARSLIAKAVRERWTVERLWYAAPLALRTDFAVQFSGSNTVNWDTAGASAVDRVLALAATYRMSPQLVAALSAERARLANRNPVLVGLRREPYGWTPVWRKPKGKKR